MSEPNAESVLNSARTRQLLGMKGAEVKETALWKIRLQLMKPITWIPLIWGVVCGRLPLATSLGLGAMSCLRAPVCCWRGP